MSEKVTKESIKKKIAKIFSNVKNDVSKETKEFKKKNGSLGTLVLYAVVIAMLLFSSLLIRKTISIGAKALTDEFKEAESKAHDSVYQKYYDDAEKKYHVANRATINLGSIKEISKFEVYSVVESACIKQTSYEQENGIYFWEKYAGEGIFTIDLSQAEFILDEDNHYILIRIPQPEMTEFSILSENTETYLYAYDKKFRNGNYNEGTELAISAEKRGYKTIKESIYNNQDYIKYAKDAAKKELGDLIRTLNVNTMSDLKIDIEFFD